MIDRVQTLRSSTPANRPTGQPPGVLYVNLADLQLGAVNASNAAQDLIGVRFFSTGASYAIGAYVVQGAFIYRALVAVSAGAFNPAQWSQVATLADVSTAVSAAVVGPNRLDNGDMWVDQHNNGASLVLGVGQKIITDRFVAAASKASKITFGQNYNGLAKCPGFNNFLGAQTTAAVASPAAADFFTIYQGTEFNTVSDLMWGSASAQPVACSFWVCSSLTGTFSGFLQCGSSSQLIDYIFTYNIPVANTWTKIVIAAPGATNALAAGTGISVGFDLGSGSAFRTATTNTWLAPSASGWQGAVGAVNVCATLNAKWAVTGVKLEVGSVATPYPVEELSRKLARCQRYFQVGQIGFQGYAVAGTQPYVSQSFPVQMWNVPNYTIDIDNSTNAGSLSIVDLGGGMGLTLIGSGVVVDGLYTLNANYSASAEI